MGGADQVAVPRGQHRQVLVEQFAEGLEVGAHVPVGRIDDHGGALHHVVAGEQHLRLLQQVAKVVRGVARRVDRAQRKAASRFAQLDALPVLQDEVRLEARVLALRRKPAEQLRAGCGLERGRTRRVVHVGVRAQDPADVLERLDLLQVGNRIGSRVDHRQLVLANQVGVGARPGHHARVRRDEARHPAVQALRHARREVVSRLARLLGIAPVDFEVRRVGAPEQLRAVLALGPAGPVGLDFRARDHRLHRLRGAREPLQVVERGTRGEYQFDLATLAAIKRVSGSDPQLVHRFVLVVRAFLPFGRNRDEEARVEAPRRAGRGDPVAVVGQLAVRNVQAFIFQQLGERPAAVASEGSRAFGGNLPGGVVQQENAGFLEALPHGGDPVWRKQVRANVLARRVGRIERAAGKYVGAAEERGLLRALHHQYFHPACAVAQQNQRGCRPGHHRG